MDQQDTQVPIDYHALAELRFHIRCFLRFSEQVARTAEIEPQQYQLLLAIKGLPAGIKPTIGELAERLQLQHNSTVELADRLVDRRLIERQRDSHDQRFVILTLTVEGETLLQQLAFYHRAELQTVGPALLRALEAILGPQTDTLSPSLGMPEESR